MAHVSSDAQQGDVMDEPTSPIHPIAPFPPLFVTSAETDSIRKPVKRASGGRAPEFYGFVAWLVTLLVYTAYILWTFLPDELIRMSGIEWYPAREWAILIPAWSVVLFLTAYFVYIALGIYGTPSFGSLSAFTDLTAHFPSQTGARNDHSNNSDAFEQGRSLYDRQMKHDMRLKSNPYAQFALPNAVPAPFDLPPAVVNRVLYGKRSKAQDPETTKQ